MNAKRSLLRLLSQLGGHGLSPEFYQALQVLAEREGVPPGVLAENLVSDALRQRRVTEDARRRWEKLTPREQQVVRMLCQGCGRQEIAGQLYLSPATVKAHIRNILHKLGLRSCVTLRQAFYGFDFPE